MSLYYEAATFIADSNAASTSLKSRVYNSKSLKSTPAQVFALVSEASKWSPILKEVVEKSQLLVHERKLSPPLALLLVHDLLLAKRGISAPAAHGLRAAVERHKARLQAELTKSRLRRGIPTVEGLRAYVEAGTETSNNGALADCTCTTAKAKKWPHSRWIRVNTIKTTLKEQLKTTFAEYSLVTSLKEVLEAKPADLLLHVDKHIPNLVAIPPGCDPTTWPAYHVGKLILQDKASCFPAYLLDPGTVTGGLVDACAAPGNKTTHLAMLAHEVMIEFRQGKLPIAACERDTTRAKTLEKMVEKAGAEWVSVKAGQDFLRLDPDKYPWRNCGGLLLDPSCSGSGIIGRDDIITAVLPSRDAVVDSSNANGRQSKKRKRNSASVAATSSATPKELVSAPAPEQLIEPTDENPITEDAATALETRLASLSAFQTKLLLHAMSFPSANRITYSTCSIHDVENESVVMRALTSHIALGRGWRVMRRDEQVEGMRAWERRGRVEACIEGGAGADDALLIAEACIRCEKYTEDGTQGFFVVGFVRDSVSRENRSDGDYQATRDEDEAKVEEAVVEEEEWGGFDD